MDFERKKSLIEAIEKAKTFDDLCEIAGDFTDEEFNEVLKEMNDFPDMIFVNGDSSTRGVNAVLFKTLKLKNKVEEDPVYLLTMINSNNYIYKKLFYSEDTALEFLKRNKHYNTRDYKVFKELLKNFGEMTAKSDFTTWTIEEVTF